jgi:hypothetical protein
MCVVMQNIFFGLDLVENVYDLKGSEVNRLAIPSGEKSFTRLDTNFLIDRDSIPYLLEPSVYDKTVFALTEDANFLKEQGVIDYSLLAIESGTNLRMGIIDFMRPYHFVEKI